MSPFVTALIDWPRVVLISQLKEVYIDGELGLVDAALWFAKVAHKDYWVGLNTIGNGRLLEDGTPSSCGMPRRPAGTPM